MRSTLKRGFITGTIVGAFAVSFFIIANRLNNGYSWGMQASDIRGLGGLLTILILGTGIYLAIRAVKQEQNCRITYWQAIKTGVLVAVITGVITALFSVIYCSVINPGYARYMLAEAQKIMKANGETQQQIKLHSEAVKSEYSTGMQVIQALIGQTFIGTIWSLIIGLFLRSPVDK